MKKQFNLSESERDFIKCFNKLSQYHQSRAFNSFDVWNDFITAVATSINIDYCTDEKRKNKLVQEQNNAIKRLGNQSLYNDLQSILIKGCKSNPNQDFLGDLFMKLELNNHWKGQYFTPYSLCEAMAAINLFDSIDKIREKGWISIYDPACGAGSTLIAAANYFTKKGIIYETAAFFVGQDIDRLVAMMCYIQLACLNCAGYIVVSDTISSPIVGNTVLEPNIQEDQEYWFLPGYFSKHWSEIRKNHKGE